ncbi:MAG: helix-turn-helix transcriptional regulator [Acutalibacteraceae bacterium]|nr:helix-turn-helix transcriptional regulator [Acutalibacteraceae bacterium]
MVNRYYRFCSFECGVILYLQRNSIMEFNEKLQELRKNKGLTQEELAEVLYVSRTAISKWESGRGYPNIESLKEISKFFDVSIDDLLSGEKLISIAEKENKSNIRNICDFLFGVVDLFSFVLVVLPLYPNTIDGFIYSVSLLNYTETSSINLIVYWVMFLSLFAVGVIKIILTKTKAEKGNEILMTLSIALNIFIVIFLALTREVYAVVVAFLLLVVKGGIVLKYSKSR